MYYIKSQPTDDNYGNPQSNKFSDSIAIPDELLTDYVACRGFALLTVENGIVASIAENTDALNAYLAAHPDAPAPTPSELRRQAYTIGSVGETDWHIERDGITYTCDELTQLGLQYEFRGETETADAIKALVSAKIAEIRDTYPDAAT